MTTGPRPLLAPLWLAHHRVHQLDRCLAVGRLRLCARCSGLYPALLLALAIGASRPLGFPFGTHLRLALAAEVLLLAPALWEVGRGRAGSPAGSNGARVASGVALGLVLGHAAQVIHRAGPFSPEALLPLLACFAAALWLLSGLSPSVRDEAFATPPPADADSAGGPDVQLTDGPLRQLRADSPS